MNEILSLSYNLTQNNGRWLLTTVGNAGIGTLTFLIEMREVPIYLSMMQQQDGVLFPHFTTDGQDDLLTYDMNGEGLAVNFAIAELTGSPINPFLAANQLAKDTTVTQAIQNRIKFIGVDGAICDTNDLNFFTCILPKLGGVAFVNDYTLVPFGCSTAGATGIASGLNWIVSFSAQPSPGTDNLPSTLTFEKIL